MNVSIVTKIPSQYQKQFIRHIPILSVSRQLKVFKEANRASDDEFGDPRNLVYYFPRNVYCAYFYFQNQSEGPSSLQPSIILNRVSEASPDLHSFTPH